MMIMKDLEISHIVHNNLLIDKLFGSFIYADILSKILFTIIVKKKWKHKILTAYILFVICDTYKERAVNINKYILNNLIAKNSN